ncbi:MAG TPA: peptide-methionine (S)-S-oxide reductase MsrA [Pyrinomonadaceae bacterium]|jgi:peptide-methionine (S)-S-oxide reductase
MLKSLSIVFALLLVGCALLRGAGAASADAVAVPDPVVDAPLAAAKGEQTAVLAGGCFWGVEAVFEHVKGVKSVTSGYAGGGAKPARYEAVSSGTTGHAESVRISYDPSQITYGQLLKVFFAVAHDPTELNRQGPDTGTQYRSAIFYASQEQRRIAESYVEQLNRANVFGRPVVTQVSALDSFHPAESYHQDYLALHPDEPYIVVNDLPKLRNLRKQFPQLYVSR